MAEKHSTVEYRDILGFPGYRVGNDGSVWSCWKNNGGSPSTMCSRWKKMKTSKPDSKHYSKVGLSRMGKVYGRLVHRLVIEAFVGLIPKGMDSRHIDGNRWNNTAANLCIGTRKENMADARRHGLAHDGEKNGMAKMNVREVRAIRLLLKVGIPVAEISKQLDRPYSTIQNIKTGIRWSRVS